MTDQLFELSPAAGFCRPLFHPAFTIAHQPYLTFMQFPLQERIKSSKKHKREPPSGKNKKATYEETGSKRLRGASSGEDIEGHFRCCMLGLPQGAAVIRAFEKLPIEDHGGLKARRVVRSFSDARVRWQIEATPLSKLLKMILVHTCNVSSYSAHTSSLSAPTSQLYLSPLLPSCTTFLRRHPLEVNF